MSELPAALTCVNNGNINIDELTDMTGRQTTTVRESQCRRHYEVVNKQHSRCDRIDCHSKGVGSACNTVHVALTHGSVTGNPFARPGNVVSRKVQTFYIDAVTFWIGLVPPESIRGKNYGELTRDTVSYLPETLKSEIGRASFRERG